MLSSTACLLTSRREGTQKLLPQPIRQAIALAMRLHSSDQHEILTLIERLALDAGRLVMEIAAEGIAAEAKADSSPVTRADREAELIILSGLRQHFPDYPVVAEEEMSAGLAPHNGSDVFFLVDPLDGTREFVAGNDDFTVNIALIDKSVPVLGVVYAPACRQLYLGRPGLAEMVTTSKEHQPLQRRKISVRQPMQPLIVVASRSHLTPETGVFIASLGPVECASIGSSLKFCLLAAGKADLYPRIGRTMQWDTAAGDAVLRAAGGMTSTMEGRPLTYGAQASPVGDLFANPDFVAEGGGWNEDRSGWRQGRQAWSANATLPFACREEEGR